MKEGIRSRIHLVLVPALVFLALYLFAEYVIRIEADRQHEILRNQTIANTAALRAKLEGEVNSTIYLARGLGGYVSAYGTLDAKDVNVVLGTVYGYSRHLRNIALAPDNVISFVYPLKGNEKALGLNYHNVPDQWPPVQRAMETGNTVVAGPVHLVQGGEGLISRTPVFRPNGEYWGIVSLIMDIEALFSTLDNAARETGLVWALRGKDGRGAQGEVFHGDARLFQSQNVLQTIVIPGGSWELAAAPVGGWVDRSPRIWLLRIGGLLLSLLVAALTYVAFSERIHIRHLATHDPLTNLPNRRLLSDRLEQAIAKARREGTGFAILGMDLDNFKPINDQYGHYAGDEVLRTVSSRLQQSLRNMDTVARIGGDEFLAILPNAGEGCDAFEVAERIAKAVQEPIRFGQHMLQVGISIGICHYPRHAQTEDELMSVTDAAMYRAKKSAHGSIYEVDELEPD